MSFAICAWWLYSFDYISPIDYMPPQPREVAMRFLKTLTFIILAMGLVFALSAWAQQKPFTQEQVSNMVRAGLGDDSGAKLIEQRGIDFAPAGDFLQSLKAAGASEAFLKALRAAKRPKPVSAKKPLNQVQVFALLVGGVPSQRVTMLVQERGIDFEPTDDYLQEAHLAGGEDELISALKNAKVTKPVTVDPAAEARQAEVRQRVARGAEFFQKGQYVQAEQEYRAALLLNPQNADLYVGLANILDHQKKWDDAATAGRKAIHLNPNDDMAHNNLSVVLEHKGDLDGAITEGREAVRLNPNNDTVHNNLGVALGNKGDWDGQIAEERAALRLKPSNDLAHANLGAALGNKGDWDGATAEYREALRLNPNNDLAHANLGTALGHKGDWDGEITEERAALRLNHNNGLAHAGLGVGLEKKGDRRGALEEFRAAYALDPTNAQFKQAYEHLSQPLPHPAEATATDISGEWKSLTNGKTFRIRLEQGHAYVELVVTEEESKLGVFHLCDLGNEGDKYQGTCRNQGTARWYDRWDHQWRTRRCQFQRQVEFTKYSPSRIEGRLETQGLGEKWSDKDNSNCGKRFPVVWTDFIWIRAN